jgi:hypothetical protein
VNDIFILLGISGSKLSANADQLSVIFDIMQLTASQLFHHTGKQMLDEQIIQFRKQCAGLFLVHGAALNSVCRMGKNFDELIIEMRTIPPGQGAFIGQINNKNT